MPLIVIRDEEEAAARQAAEETQRPEGERLARLLELRGPPHPDHPRWHYEWDEGSIKTSAPPIYRWLAVRDDGVFLPEGWWARRQDGAFGEMNPMQPWTSCPETVLAWMAKLDGLSELLVATATNPEGEG